MNANELCPNCGEYHSCTELIQEQQERIEKLGEAYGKQCTRANELACQVRDLKNENVALQNENAALQNDLNMANWMIGKAQEK